jgi:hypothetical protein
VGLTFNETIGECSDGSASPAAAEAAPKKKSSLVGQIIGYCVSGVVLILCCAITLLHQKRKQEEEEAARKQYKLEQEKLQAANQPKDEHGDGAGEWELDSLKKPHQLQGDFHNYSPTKPGINPTKKKTGPTTSSTFDANQPHHSKIRKSNMHPSEHNHLPQPNHFPDFELQGEEPSPGKNQKQRPSAATYSNTASPHFADSKPIMSWQPGPEVANNSPTLKVMVKKPKDGFGLNYALNEPQTQINSGAKTNGKVSAFGAPKL